jgi:hypothetical protein
VAAGPEAQPVAEPSAVERDKSCFISSLVIGIGFAGVAMCYSVSLYAHI